MPKIVVSDWLMEVCKNDIKMTSKKKDLNYNLNLNARYTKLWLAIAKQVFHTKLPVDSPVKIN